MENNIGERLYILRTNRGESQDEVADASDISRVSYTRYESNQREPKASAAVRLARHFGVTVEYLFGYEEASDSPALSLGDKEKTLLNIYFSLNEQGKEWLLNSARMARDNPQFAKDTSQNAAI